MEKSMVASRAGRGRAAPAGGRRRLLLAGLAGASVFVTRLARAQTFTATSISQAAQDARRDVGQLGRRADDLLRRTAAAGLEQGGAAVRRFRTEQVSLARDLAAIFNGRVAEDDWLLIVPTRELGLVLTMRPLVIRLAPKPAEVEAALKEPLPQIAPQPGDSADDVLLAIVLVVSGLPHSGMAAARRLKSDAGLTEALKAVAGAVQGQHYGLAALELQHLMNMLVLPRTIAIINERFGPDAERTLYKALTVRFVPFIGWTYFVTLLLAAIYQNRDTTAPVLR